jgi:CRISPR-associated endonuclease/helicase Cas3
MSEIQKLQHTTIHPAYIPTPETPQYSFPYEPPRNFQVDFMDWLREDDSEPVSAITAPTGGGKSATFHKTIQTVTESQGTVLLVYPTNALIRDQKEELEEEIDDVTVEHITSETLEEHGIQRSRELKSYFRRLSTDVVITNPDILQAVVQGMYVDPVGNLVEIFEYCEAVVFDEFHFYDEFEASGILLQIHIAVNRLEQLGEANIVLASATPDETYFDLLDDIGIDYRKIEAEVTDDGSKFRCETDVTTYDDYIGNSLDDVATDIRHQADKVELEQDGIEIAVICNSVKASNLLYNKIHDRYPDLAEYVVKDNGYDTGLDFDMDGTVLITTSKAEVGINHDIKYLYMDNPFRDPDSFIQRFGRAGRSSKASVKMYGMGEIPALESEMAYTEFIDVIYDAFWQNHADYEQTKSLIGLRAAYAAYNRTENSREELKEQTWRDLSTAELFDYWYAFLEEFNAHQSGYIPRDVQNIYDIVDNSLDTLKSLRGRSYNIDIEYRRGDEQVQTDYSLLSAITQYGIRKIEDESIVVDGELPEEKHSMYVKGVDKKFTVEKYSSVNGVKEYILEAVDGVSSFTEFQKKILQSVADHGAIHPDEIELEHDFNELRVKRRVKDLVVDGLLVQSDTSYDRITENYELNGEIGKVELTEKGEKRLDMSVDNLFEIKPMVQDYLEIQNAGNLSTIDELKVQTEQGVVELEPETLESDE